jgi:glycosyltransferase involved in cell wall biosynthesis
MRRPFFSIITTTLNAGNSLNKTIQSVAQQTYSDYEHLIKDGGSTDGSVECAVTNLKQRIISKRDSGIYNAMNQALEESTGEYVLFLNSGDIFYNNKVLHKVSNILNKNKTDLLYGHIEDNGVIITYPKVLTNWYMYRNSICHQAWFLSRRCYELCDGFNLNYKVLADHNILLELILRFKISYQLIKQPVVSIMPMGFSAVNNATRASERKYLMRYYFHNKKGKLMAIIYAITFPGIRIWMSKNTLTRKIYSKLQYILNQTNWL